MEWKSLQEVTWSTQVRAKQDQALRPLSEHGRQAVPIAQGVLLFSFFFFRALTGQYPTGHAVTRRGKARELAEFIYTSSD